MAISALEAGRPGMARPIIARAIASGDASAFIHIAAGRAALVEGEGLTALECAQRGLDGAAIEADLDARLAALELQGRALDYLGSRDEAEAAWTQQATEAAAAARTQAQLRAVVQLGKVELFAGRPPKRLYEAVELARSAGALVELAWAEENLSISLALNGDLGAAKAVLDEAIPRCRGLRLDQLAYLLATRAMIESYTAESVEDRLAEAEAMSPTPDLLLHTSGMRTDIALRAGDYVAAIHWSKVCNELVRTMPGAVPTDGPCWLVWALAAAGRPVDAVRALDEARAIPGLARWHGRPVVVAVAAAVLVGDEVGVDNAIAGATGVMPIDIALMRVLAAEIIKGPARVRWLREALDTYESIGAPLDADRARRLLREAGGPVPRRRRTTGRMPDEFARAGVTAREAEVLAFWATVCQTPTSPDRLYVSVRTVESHVSALLAKLGAAKSRATHRSERLDQPHRLTRPLEPVVPRMCPVPSGVMIGGSHNISRGDHMDAATTTIEQITAKAEEFAGRLLSIYSGSMLTYMVDIGHRTGLFIAAAGGPATSDQLADRAGLSERYVREWLGAMVTGGIFGYDPANGIVLPPSGAGRGAHRWAHEPRSHGRLEHPPGQARPPGRTRLPRRRRRRLRRVPTRVHRRDGRHQPGVLRWGAHRRVPADGSITHRTTTCWRAGRRHRVRHRACPGVAGPDVPGVTIHGI